MPAWNVLDTATGKRRRRVRERGLIEQERGVAAAVRREGADGDDGLVEWKKGMQGATPGGSGPLRDQRLDAGHRDAGRLRDLGGASDTSITGCRLDASS